MIKEAFARRGAPHRLRGDSEPELIAMGLRKFLPESNVETMYIEPGSPWQNGFAESFIARVKDELMVVEILASLLEAHVFSGDWKHAHNTAWPHSVLKYLTPA